MSELGAITAAECAASWYRQLFDSNMLEAWRVMTSSFRLAVTQSVLHAARLEGMVSDSVVADLSSTEPTDPHREKFWAAAHMQLLRVAHHLDPVGLRLASRPRPLGVDLELIVLVHEADLAVPNAIAPGESAQAVRLLVAWEDAVPKIAGLDYLLEPGWPPQVVLHPPTDE